MSPIWQYHAGRPTTALALPAPSSRALERSNDWPNPGSRKYMMSDPPLRRLISLAAGSLVADMQNKRWIVFLLNLFLSLGNAPHNITLRATYLAVHGPVCSSPILNAPPVP